MEDAGIDPATSRMLCERSTIGANPPPYIYRLSLEEFKSAQSRVTIFNLVPLLT